MTVPSGRAAAVELGDVSGHRRFREGLFPRLPSFLRGVSAAQSTTTCGRRGRPTPPPRRAGRGQPVARPRACRVRAAHPACSAGDRATGWTCRRAGRGGCAQGGCGPRWSWRRSCRGGPWSGPGPRPRVSRRAFWGPGCTDFGRAFAIWWTVWTSASGAWPAETPSFLHPARTHARQGLGRGGEPGRGGCREERRRPAQGRIPSRTGHAAGARRDCPATAWSGGPSSPQSSDSHWSRSSSLSSA